MTIYSIISDKIERAQKEWVSARSLMAIATSFPNAKRIGCSELIMDSAANPLVDHVSFRKSCGCCPEPFITAEPYLIEEGGVEVSSDPHKFDIGSESYAGNAIPRHGWEDDLRSAKISEKVIDIIRQYLEDGVKQEEIDRKEASERDDS